MPVRYRKHIRRHDHDYTQGTYFVTLCTRFREQVFGRIEGTGPTARVDLTDVGRIVNECWRAIPHHFPHVRLDETQIMPDHLHAILILGPGQMDQNCRATRWVAATASKDDFGRVAIGPRRGSIGAVIGAFKSETTKRMNRVNATRSFTLGIEGPSGFDVKVVGVEQVRLPVPFDVEGDRLRTLRVLVTVPAASLTAASVPITFRIEAAGGGESRVTETVFLSNGAEP